MCAYTHLDDLEAERRTDELVVFRISKSVRKVFKNLRIQATTKRPLALAGGGVFEIHGFRFTLLLTIDQYGFERFLIHRAQGQSDQSALPG